jgi:hypothetical protein
MAGWAEENMAQGSSTAKLNLRKLLFMVVWVLVGLVGAERAHQRNQVPKGGTREL